MGKPGVLTLAAAVLAGSIALAGTGSSIDQQVTQIARGDGPIELPRGGTSVLPEFRVVSFYGAPQARGLGILGIGSPNHAGARLKKRIKAYQRPKRPVLPGFELIAAIALDSAGKDGKYRSRQPHSVIRRYLKAARRINAILILDIQPGRSSFVSEVKALKPFLREPDVGIALDPEWRMHGKQTPGSAIGHVGAAEVNRTTAYMQDMISRLHLPDKLLVIHQFTPHMVRQRSKLKARAGIDTVLNSDGFGTPGQKKARYRDLAPKAGSPFFRGFKLFYVEDTGLMSPSAVRHLKPGPVDLVIYE